MDWREYHEATKHSPESLRRERYGLDWASMPDPFRHYDGVPVLDLPADPPLTQEFSTGAQFLSQLLFYSAAISATKVVPQTGYRYALRVNPSSGNLHPTEFHFATSGLAEWPDGLYHYRPSSHMAEQRALGNYAARLGGGSVVFVLTSIAWREAWKYRRRAYRYCLHDMGHAWQSLAMSARAAGWDSFAKGSFVDDDISALCGLPGDEWPMLIVRLDATRRAAKEQWFGGTPNRLSEEQVPYPIIDQVHAATKLPSRTGSGEIRLPAPAVSSRPFAEVARTRRSALDFIGGDRTMSLPQLSALLAHATQPLAADFASSRLVQLYLYAHRVEGLAPGVYRHWPASNELKLIREGEQRVAAAGLSLGQDLAGNCCAAFSMIADLGGAACAYGDRGYRYAHFEAGAIGQHLYITAESLGLRATGIGAFFDDQVHEYLGIQPAEGQVIYHFAVGYPVFDPRLSA
jgi:SagB-type dehydrogenase family enzyme